MIDLVKADLADMPRRSLNARPAVDLTARIARHLRRYHRMSYLMMADANPTVDNSIQVRLSK